jgi:succinate dehydrogenase/fumarate reductase-like Fe-S protein
MSTEMNYVRLKILRYDPQEDKTPHRETYWVPITGEKMNLLQALETIYQEQDDTLAFRHYCCGIQYCNSCLMLINGKQAHACLTIVNPGDEFEVAPVRGKRVLRDLVVEGEFGSE